MILSVFPVGNTQTEKRGGSGENRKKMALEASVGGTTTRCQSELGWQVVVELHV